MAVAEDFTSMISDELTCEDSCDLLHVMQKHNTIKNNGTIRSTMFIFSQLTGNGLNRKAVYDLQMFVLRSFAKNQTRGTNKVALSACERIAIPISLLRVQGTKL